MYQGGVLHSRCPFYSTGLASLFILLLLTFDDLYQMSTVIIASLVHSGSLSWGMDMLCSGSRDHSILCWDHRESSRPVKKYLGHSQEVCGLRWSPDHQLLASGGNDNKVQCVNILPV